MAPEFQTFVTFGVLSTKGNCPPSIFIEINFQWLALVVMPSAMPLIWIGMHGGKSKKCSSGKWKFLPFKCLSKLRLKKPPPLTMLLRINTHSPHSYTSQLSKVFSVALLKPDTTQTNIARILCCNAIAGIHSRKYSKVVCYSNVI